MLPKHSSIGRGFFWTPEASIAPHPEELPAFCTGENYITQGWASLNLRRKANIAGYPGGNSLFSPSSKKPPP